MDEPNGPLLIEGDADVEGHAWRGYVSEEDERVLRDALRERLGGPVHVTVQPDEDDTEGHASRPVTAVRLSVGDDTEGHAVNLHFPSAAAADAFRRRLVAAGVLAGTIAIGGMAASALGGQPGQPAIPSAGQAGQPGQQAAGDAVPGMTIESGAAGSDTQPSERDSRFGPAPR